MKILKNLILGHDILCQPAKCAISSKLILLMLAFEVSNSTKIARESERASVF